MQLTPFGVTLPARGPPSAVVRIAPPGGAADKRSLANYCNKDTRHNLTGGRKMRLPFKFG